VRVLVDTCVWSAVLRRESPDRQLTRAVTELVEEGRLVMIGPIRQELLSGVREKTQFDRPRKRLSAFPDLPLESHHYETAARFYNTCRTKGARGSHVDFLICAVCHLEKTAILTTDRDFESYAAHLGVSPYVPQS
jgi:predicted nucleic acid-binding protein